MPYGTDSPVVSPEWLAQHQDDPDLVIIDCRFNLFDAQWGHQQYHKGHIPGAFFADLHRDLAEPPTAHGGRHPLPTPDHFTHVVQRWGVGANTKVVSYDVDGQGAARLWWLLQYYGHPWAYVLDGGLGGYESRGGKLSQDSPSAPIRGTFVAHPDPSMVVDYPDVLASLSRRVFIDARSRERYEGELDPIDQPPGHIPGAINRPWQGNLEQGCFRSPDSLAQRFQDFDHHDDIIAYCGSGVSACVNIVALRLIGHAPKLYPGSWSDWITYPDSPIARGSEPGAAS